MSEVPDRLFLIGPMGAGKSAIGRQLARRLAVPFRDSDRDIQERTGVDIPLIFELEGETGFRKRERQVIAELCELPRVVLATGGGAVLDPGIRDLLGSSGFVIYLSASVTAQLSRTRRGRHRPLLETPDPERRLGELLAAREPLYREIAHLTVPTDGQKVQDVTERIIRHFASGAAQSAGAGNHGTGAP